MSLSDLNPSRLFQSLRRILVKMGGHSRRRRPMRLTAGTNESALEQRALLTSYFTCGVDSWNSGQVSAYGQFVSFTTPQKGTLSQIQSNGSFVYTANQGAIGEDRFFATFRFQTSGGWTTIQKECVMNIYLPVYPQTDERYDLETIDENNQPIVYEDVNYFVFEGNTLTIPAEDGVLKNDTQPQYVQYLTAVQVGNGQYGSFSISGSGAFTYTPNASVFSNPYFSGLEDTCQYQILDPTGQHRGMAMVKVDLAKAYVMRDNFDVDTNPNQLTSWVGERIGLIVGVKGEANLLGANVEWCIQGDAIDDYIESTEGNEIVPLSSDEIEQSSIDFYWWKKGIYDVSVSVVTANGLRGTDGATFDIKKPNRQLTAQTSGVTITQTGPGIATVGLGTFGPVGNLVIPAGIDFDQTSAAGDPASSYRFTQTFTIVASYVYDDDRVERGKMSSLDNGLAYEQQPAGGTNTYAADSPRTNLSPDWKRLTETFRARMFMMFRSDRPGSIWVPLQEVEWMATWTVEKDANGIWSILSSDWTRNPIAIDSDSYPNWTRNFEPGDELDLF